MCLCQQQHHYATLSQEQKDKIANGPSLGDFISGDVDETDIDSSSLKYEGVLKREKGIKRYCIFV